MDILHYVVKRNRNTMKHLNTKALRSDKHIHQTANIDFISTSLHQDYPISLISSLLCYITWISFIKISLFIIVNWVCKNIKYVFHFKETLRRINLWLSLIYYCILFFTNILSNYFFSCNNIICPYFSWLLGSVDASHHNDALASWLS